MLWLLQACGDGSLQQWRSKLEYSVYEVLGSMRIREMFDIVVDYPETRPALQDLKACLIHTNLHSYFISCFRQETEARLLHPGKIITWPALSSRLLVSCRLLLFAI